MTQEEREDAIDYIKNQTEYGYVDLGAHDYNEMDLIKEVIAKQEPKDLCGDIVLGDTVSGKCPVCYTDFVCITPRYYKENGYGYCKQCGQKLRW